MKIGIRNVSLKMEWLDAIEAAGEIGYDGVELRIGDRADVDSLLTERGREALLEAVDTHRCAVSSLACGIFRQVNFGDPAAEVRARGVDLLCDTLRACAAVGAVGVLVPHFDRQHIDISAGEEATFVEGLKRCAPVAEETHVFVCLETSFSVEQLKRICAAVGSTHVGVYQDTANAIIYGHDSPDMLRRLAQEIRMIHIKDTDHKPLGEASVPWPECVAAIRESGYGADDHPGADWLVLETPPGDDPIGSAKKNLAFTRDLASQIGN